MSERSLAPRALSAVAVFALMGGVSGCGPIMSTSLIIDAEAKLAASRAAEAEKYAPYEYTAATEYLHKAHEELGYADYGPAIDYAYKAAAAADKGVKRASDEKSREIDRSNAGGAPVTAVPVVPGTTSTTSSTTTTTTTTTTAPPMVIKRAPTSTTEQPK